MGSSEFAGVTLLSVLSEGSYRIYPEHESVNDYVNAIRTVVKMPDGGFWFGTRQGNVYAYDKNLEAASCYKMPYNYIYAASCDGDGKLWLGTVRWVYVLTDVGIIKWQVIPCHWHMRIYSIFIVMIK